MKESPIRTERKTIHLPPDTIRALNKLAARNGTDFSKEVRRAIDEYLDLASTAENIDMISGVIRQVACHCFMSFGLCNKNGTASCGYKSQPLSARSEEHTSELQSQR